jgi:hypothetical protein
MTRHCTGRKRAGLRPPPSGGVAVPWRLRHTASLAAAEGKPLAMSVPTVVA